MLFLVINPFERIALEIFPLLLTLKLLGFATFREELLGQTGELQDY